MITNIALGQAIIVQCRTSLLGPIPHAGLAATLCARDGASGAMRGLTVAGLALLCVILTACGDAVGTTATTGTAAASTGGTTTTGSTTTGSGSTTTGSTTTTGSGSTTTGSTTTTVGGSTTTGSTTAGSGSTTTGTTTIVPTTPVTPVQSNSGGTLALNIAGTMQGVNYDYLNVAGAASLAGTLVVNFTNSFVPTSGQKFVVIIAAGGLSGAFSNVTTNGVAVTSGQDATSYFITVN